MKERIRHEYSAIERQLSKLVDSRSSVNSRDCYHFVDPLGTSAEFVHWSEKRSGEYRFEHKNCAAKVNSGQRKVESNTSDLV